ncbi:MAG TPA: hypothetical protein VLT59_12435, partial [Steroidobacteraceae bacterium]|nr:hypothetical protein [Steroidobacteraceae bacterium]
VLAGLGLALLVRSIGQMLEARGRIQLYWIHTTWLGFIFIAHVNSWFLLWQFHDVRSWTIGEFLLLLSVPTLLYLISHVAVPEIPEEIQQRFDMRAHYYARFRMIMGLLAASIALNFATEFLLLDQVAASQANAFRLVVLVLLGIGMTSSRPAVQAAVTSLLLVVFLAGLRVLDTRIE